jgi:adenylosuccinate lyase
MERTLPRPVFSKDFKPDIKDLTAGRYGTEEMINIWGPEATIKISLLAQGQAAITLHEFAPEIISTGEAEEIYKVATEGNIDPNRVRELEEKTGHDVIAINLSLEEKLSEKAKSHVNKGRTSADTTQTARAIQFQYSLEEVAESVENLRDIIIEKSVDWKNIPHIDNTHLYDALPTVAGRPWTHYAEMLNSNLVRLRDVYDKSLVGKWADATGNHHSVFSLGIDGIKLQENYCNGFGLEYMIAPAQVPGLEFEADVFYMMARIGETLNNIAKYMAWGKSDDVNIFKDINPKKRKGSSAMPHKDAKGGNPTVEEQIMSLRNYLQGNLMTALSNCEMPYARNLAASANGRINAEDGFKFLDHGIRRLASAVYWLDIDKDRAKERLDRTYGITTSQEVMTYLTDPRKVEDPMPRSKAHDLMGNLATKAYNERQQFVEVLLECDEVTKNLDSQTIIEITDSSKYIGQSKEIIEAVREKFYKKETL